MANMANEKEADSDLKKLFEKAALYVKSVAGTLSSEKLLYFYARFKQANEGPCNTSKPGFFAFQGKQKWTAWKSLGDMSQEDAMSEYVDEVSDVDLNWIDKIDSGEVKAPRGLGVGVSTMSNTDPPLSDNQKTIFDWCIEGSVDQVVDRLAHHGVNTADSEGLSLLHWACDRGLEDMVRTLLEHKADVNLKDTDKQTPLHYAVSCDHIPVVKLLLAHEADTTIEDADGQTPNQLADTPEMQLVLKNR